MNQTLITIDPHDCKIHPRAAHVPGLQPDQLDRFKDRVRSHGIERPLIVTRHGDKWLVVEGADAWAAARAWQLKEIPAIEIAEEEAAGFIVSALVNRRDFTQAAKAYLLYPLFKEAHQEAVKRNHENLRKGQCSPGVTECPPGKTVAEFAKLIGISETLFKQAAKVHDLFAKHPDFKAEMEPKLLGVPVGGEHTAPPGLGAILAGFEGRELRGKERPEGRGDEQLFFKGFNSTIIRSLRLPDLKVATRQMGKVIAALDDLEDVERVEQMGKEMQKLAADRRKELAG